MPVRVMLFGFALSAGCMPVLDPDETPRLRTAPGGAVDAVFSDGCIVRFDAAGQMLRSGAVCSVSHLAAASTARPRTGG